MLIQVHVTPNSRRATVTKVGELSFEVKVDEKAIDGKANKRLLELMSRHLGVPKSKIAIVRGAKSMDKVLELVV